MRTTLALLALGLAYAALTRSSGVWLAETLLAPSSRGNLIVLGLLAILAARQIRKPQLATNDVAHLPLVLVAAAAIAYVSVRWFFPWHRLHAVIALIGAYGMLGCFVSASTWRRAFAGLALVIVVLPFGEQLDVFVGYPLRIVIADVAHCALQHIGVPGTSRSTLLVFDSGAAQIDLPCSGVKSLWAGALLALAAPLVLSKRFGVRWLAASITFGLALCLGNTLRIILLVVLAVPAQQPVVAEVIHRPLGCAAFVAAAIAYIAYLKRGRDTPHESMLITPAPAWLALATAAGIALLTPLAPASASTHALSERAFVKLPFDAEPIALTTRERSFFTTQGAERASKVRFTRNDVHGSLILVRSAHANAQHPPEQCLTASGHAIADARTVILDTTLSVRLLSLGRGSAVSWFQSGYATHGDYAARVWAGGTWVQVSILFDDVDAEHVPADLVHALYRSIASSYQGDTDAAL